MDVQTETGQAAGAPSGAAARPLGPPEFFGEFPGKVDAKNRVVVPTEFRPWLVGAAYVLRMPEGFVSLLTPDEHTRLVEQARSAGRTAAGLETGRRAATAAADRAVSAVTRASQAVRPDAQGRFVVPERFLTHAGITDRIVFVGTQLRVELWSPERLDQARPDDDVLAEILGDWQARGPA